MFYTYTFLYLVSYIFFKIFIGNRRLDEWVHSSKFDVTSGHKNNRNNTTVVHGADQMDRTFTRNQKRKHDEINHVQKVL